MSDAALSWAWDQQVDWPLAKLILLRVATATLDETDRLTLIGGADLHAFTGAHSAGEVAAALEYLSDCHLIHLVWYAPPELLAWEPKQQPAGIPVGVRTCEPGCARCAAELEPDLPELPAWVQARREWQRLRPRLTRELVARDGAVCRACGATTQLTADHVIPLRRGGRNEVANLQVLCRPCNTKKGASQ